MPRWTLVLFVALLGLTLAPTASAQWKWRDSHGRTQYSDLPPPADTADKAILVRPASAVRAASAPASSPASAAASNAAPLASGTVDADLEARRKLAERAEADKRKADDSKVAASKAENCTRARDQLRTLDSGIRISRVNSRGEREVLDDPARADETRRARDTVSADCR